MDEILRTTYNFTDQVGQGQKTKKQKCCDGFFATSEVGETQAEHQPPSSFIVLTVSKTDIICTKARM